VKRRHFLQGVAASAALSVVNNSFAEDNLSAFADGSADNENFWQAIRVQYDLPADIIQLENGNWGAMSRPVMKEYFAQTQKVNTLSSYYSRRQFLPEFFPVLKRTAELLGAGDNEIAFTRGATEALMNLISNYRGLKPGDAVMYADTDYDSAQAAFDKWQQRGMHRIIINLPEQATGEEYVAFYRTALEKNPQVKLLLLTHMSHRHGLVIPVKEIVAAARKLGVDCIVDAAHSWGQLDFNLRDLGADFIAFNLHKWMGTPLGAGVMYIRDGRLQDIAQAPGDGSEDTSRIYTRVHSGTLNMASWLTVPAALDFHAHMGGGKGSALKAARLAYLRRYWWQQVADIKGVELIAAENDHAMGAISSLRLKGQTSVEANKAIAARLLQEFNIFSVHRSGLAGGACVRITPSVFNTPAELDKLATAIKKMAV